VLKNSNDIGRLDECYVYFGNLLRTKAAIILGVFICNEFTSNIKKATQAFTSDLTDCLVCIFYYASIEIMIKFPSFKIKDKYYLEISVFNK